MRRIIGLVMVGLGVCLIALAIALPSWVYPQIAKVPANPDQYIRAVGTGITTLVPSDVVNGGKGLYTDQTVESTRRVQGQIPPNGSTVPKGQAFYRVAFSAQVIGNPKFTGTAGLMEAYVEGGSIDGKTGNSTNCCGDYLALDADKPAGDKIVHQGLQFKFPFATKQKHNYPFWDVNIKAAPLARYDGTEKIEGLQTYRFIQVINDTTIGQETVPGALFGLKKPSVVSDRVYATTRTLWVEPYTGAIIKGQEKVNQRLSYNGKQVPIIKGTLAYDDATVNANVKNYKLAAFGLKFVTKIGPIGGWILGPIFALIGLTMLAASRREDDWDDEWDDDYDDDDYDEYDDDEDDDQDARPNQRVR